MSKPSTEQQMPQPIPNPPVHHGARRSPEDEVIAFLTANKETHTRWAKYFEDNPTVEAEYVATGVWDDAKEQRRLERGYEAAISVIRNLASRTPTPDVVEALREALERAAENLERLTVPHIVGNDVHNFAYQAAKAARAALSNHKDSRNG